MNTSDVPAPVARYLPRALPAGSMPATRARFEQEGEFRLKEGRSGWRPFTATEVFAFDPPSFEWRARIRAAPLVSVGVHDGYAAGVGRMTARLLGVVPLVDETGAGPLAEGALSRFLAEAAWFPWRLRPGGGLSWAPVDDSHARATLTDGAVRVSVEFGFDEADDLVEVNALRSRKVDAGYVTTSWNGRFEHHRVVEGVGVRIPFRGEVAWVVDGERQPYWRGSITDARFEAASP